ncbi:MAG: hypothetical protein EBX17_11480 [Betaproteobacteria bacterium]|nr:hypothetical protein [Betaproteobacteria bacterium]
MTYGTRQALHGPAEVSQGFDLIFIIGFIVIFAIALMGKLVAWDWRTWFPGAEGQGSLVPSVRAAVYTFMSHLS